MTGVVGDSEVAALRARIESTLRRVHESSMQRRHQEEQLLSSVASAELLAGFFKSQSPPAIEVAAALLCAGDEDTVEEECESRYRAFIDVKKQSFVSIESEMSSVLAQLSTAFASDLSAAVDGDVDGFTACGARGRGAGLLESRRLWCTLVKLHDCALRILANASADDFSGEIHDLESDEVIQQAREGALRRSVADAQSALEEARLRLAEVTAEAETARSAGGAAEMPHTHSGALVSFSDEKTSGFVSDARRALFDLQQATEHMRRKKELVDAETAEMREKTRMLSLQTAACRCSTQAVLERAQGAAQETAALADSGREFVRELHQKKNECAVEQDLLGRDVAKYEQLCALLEERAEKAEAEAERVATARHAHHSLMMRQRTQAEALEQLTSSLERMKEMERAVTQENQCAEEEQAYLLRLLPDRAVAERLLAGASDVSQPLPEVSRVGDYLRFVQKARLARSASIR
ncbi:hypothetical protein NESM_000767900 [Novymonas esmeraldas]|uniref:Uncharacterized protein n=1 Tax=Novymonas esmeraldas TaxID=1808958 RepID=A0AAW0EV27_9TRYP